MVQGVGASRAHAARAQQLLQPLSHQMPRTQHHVDPLLERMRVYAHIAERPPGNSDKAFNLGHRTDVFQNDTHAGRPTSTIWNGDPQSEEAATLSCQQGGQPTGARECWAQCQ
eukprot:1942801-Pyramimonas_sp.AAC.1